MSIMEVETGMVRGVTHVATRARAARPRHARNSCRANKKPLDRTEAWRVEAAHQCHIQETSSKHEPPRGSPTGQWAPHLLLTQSKHLAPLGTACPSHFITTFTCPVDGATARVVPLLPQLTSCLRCRFRRCRRRHWHYYCRPLPRLLSCRRCPRCCRARAVAWSWSTTRALDRPQCRCRRRRGRLKRQVQ